MRTIDGVRYLSAKEYAEMMNLTPGRVSQLKADLPFVKFEEFGIEVINFDLLALSQAEKALAQTKFQTATPIHELSYKDLGNYFGKLVMDLVNFKGAAGSQIDDLQVKAGDLRQKLEVLQSEKTELSKQAADLEAEVRGLKSSLEGERSENANLRAKNEALDARSKEYEDLKIVHSESLKARLAAMELSAKSDADFREEFKTFKELVMQKIK